MKSTRIAWACAAAALLTSAACSKSPSASAASVRSKAASYGSTIAANTQQAATALGAMSSVTALSNGLAPLQNAFGSTVGALSPVASGTPSFLSSRSSVRSYARLSRTTSTQSALTADEAKTIEQFLSQRVFTDANVESSDGSSVTFRLQGDDVCPYNLPDGTTSLLSAPSAVLDAGCVDDVDRHEIRVKATEPASDALNLTLLVGPERAAPLTLELRSNSLAVVASLDGVKGVLAFEHALDATSTVPQAMTGVVDLKITFNRVLSGKVDVTFSSSVRQAVSIAAQDATGTTTFATAARSPWASLQVNEIDRAVAAQLDLGPTTVSVPYYVALSGVYKQETTDLGGLGFSFVAKDGQAGDFAITNIGLGDLQTRVTLDAATVFSADLAPRHFSLAFKADPDLPGRTIFTVDPQFQLTAFLDKTPYGNTDPSYDHMTYAWSLTAAEGLPQVEPYEYQTVVQGPTYTYVQSSTALKIVKGTLSLSDGAQQVLVLQGQCLLDSAATGAASVVEQYVSGACP